MTLESTVQAAVRAEAGRLGVYLWRNNRGALPNPITGVPVRFGLGNDSARLDKVLKSSDLIGWTVTGRIVSVECKPPGWRGPSNDRERAQAAWIDLVRKCGGIAGFVTSVEDLRGLLK